MNISQDVDLFGCKKMMSGVTRFTKLVEGLGVTGAEDADENIYLARTHEPWLKGRHLWWLMASHCNLSV